MLKKIAATTLSAGYIQLAAVVAFLMTARFYGVEGRGVYASVTSIGTFSSSLLGFSIGMVLPYFVVSSGTDRDKFFKKNLSSIVALVLLLSVVAAASVAILYSVYPSLRGKVATQYLIAIGLSFPFYMWSGSNDFVFSATGEIIRQNRIAVVNRTIFLLASVVLVVVLRLSLLSYLLLYGVFNLLQMVSEIWFLARRFDADFKLDLPLMRRLVMKGVTLHAVTIAALFNTTFSILVLTYYSKDLKDVGYFNFVSQLSSMLFLLPVVVNRYLLSEITARGARAVWPKQKKVMLYCLLVMAAVCAAAFFLIEPFCQLFKREFIGAVDLFRLILLMIVPSAFCAMMQSQWYSSGFFKLMSVANVSVGLMSAAITLIAVPRFHEFGAAATTICTHVVLFLINLGFFFRLERDQRLPAQEPVATPSTGSEA